MILRNDVNANYLCPVQQILALALADRALEDVERVEDFMVRHRPPPGQPFKIVPVRSCMLDVPLLRCCDEPNGVDANRIWSYHYLHGTTEGPWAPSGGYSDALLPYNFRRGHGNTLDREYQSRACISSADLECPLGFVSAVQRPEADGS